jgi:hypothetical protein
MSVIDDIPVAHTPPGGYGDTMPPPILGDRNESLAPDAPDLRGTWSVTAVTVNGEPAPDHRIHTHVERIEQAGDRVVVTAGGVIHDMRADGTLAHGVHDVAGADFATQIHVVATFEDGVLVLRPDGLPGVEVRRWRERDELVWDYAGAFIARLSESEAKTEMSGR